MNLLVAVLCGMVAGGGLLLAALGFHGTELRQPGDEAPTSPAGTLGSFGATAAAVERRRLRLALGLVGGIAMWLVTGWPVGILLAVLVGAVAPTLVGAKARRQAVIDRTEAIAGWAEQLRDTIAAAAGLQEAVAVTARVAPAPIRPAVADLAAGMRRSSLSGELHRFSARLDDPIGDQVAVALLLAAERRGDDLTRLLDDLADAARADATMRIRTETARAQNCNDAKVVTLVVVAMFGFMLVVNRSYLDAFATWTGQAVLAVIGSLWLAALYGIMVLSQVARPPRLLAVEDRRDGGTR
ncbi:MAG: type II secretion system F family protein [Acidimicrobiia bacterium]|nr:type II secretion system F family protein [Acidimicrobiia bacterium]